MITRPANMAEPLVSVIVPCYNQGRFLKEAVHSIAAQTYRNWECVIIDDGSTDNSGEVALSLTGKHRQIRVITQTNCGQARARNRGLDEARGQFIQFLDADDVVFPTKIESQIALIKDFQKLSVLSCDYRHGKQESVWTEELGHRHSRVQLDAARPMADLVLNWETRLSIPIHCFLFDARLFREHGIRFDETLPNNEDWDCWLRVFANCVNYQYSPTCLAIYRVNYPSVSRKLPKMRRGFLAAIRKQRKRFAGNQEMLTALEQKRREIKWVYREHAKLNQVKRAGRQVVGSIAKAVLPESWHTQLKQRLHKVKRIP